MQLHSHITGSVQGVQYRSFVKSIADGMGISGTVQNMHDGSVYVVAQGEKDILTVFLQHLRTGPANSHVAHVSEEFSETEEELFGFHILERS